jgi:hypothetical protein
MILKLYSGIELTILNIRYGLLKKFEVQAA